MINKILNIYKKHKSIINYIVVGGFTTLVSIGSFALFELFIPNYMINTVLSWILAVLFAFYTNRRFVFESKNKNIIEEMISFFGSRLTTLLIEMATMYLLVDLIKLNNMIAKVFVQFIVLILNYIFSKLFVFKK